MTRPDPPPPLALRALRRRGLIITSLFFVGLRLRRRFDFKAARWRFVPKNLICFAVIRLRALRFGLARARRRGFAILRTLVVTAIVSSYLRTVALLECCA